MSDRAGPNGTNARARELLVRWVVSKLEGASGPPRLVPKVAARVMGTFDPAPGEEPAAFASRVMTELEEDTEMAGEKQLYTVYLFVQEAVTEGEGAGTLAWREDASKTIRVTPDDADAFDEDKPEASLLAQSYRMQEASQRFALQAATIALQHSEEQANKAYLREQQFRDREWEDRQLIRGTLEHRAELEARRAEADAEREVMLSAVSLFGGLAPGAISALLRNRRGGKPGPKLPEHVLLEEFVGTVRPDQFASLMGCMTDAQRIPLMGIVQGEIEPEMIPDAVRRVLADITEEQFVTILKVLDDDVQRTKFQQLFETRKHVFDLRIKVGAAALGGSAGALAEGAPSTDPGTTQSSDAPAPANEKP